MATTRKPAGTKETTKDRVSAKERARRAAQAQEATPTPTLATGESVDQVREAIRAHADGAAERREHGPVVDEPVTTAAELRARSRGELIRMPSGLVCRARRPGMIAVIQAGVIPNVLMPLVEKALEKGSRGQDVSMDEIMAEISGGVSGEMLKQMMAMFDAVTTFVVIEPQLQPNPRSCSCGAIQGIKSGSADEKHEHNWIELPEHEWPETHPVTGEDLAYVSWVPFEDKQFLLNYAVGGTRDVERFREAAQTDVVAAL